MPYLTLTVLLDKEGYIYIAYLVSVSNSHI